MLDVRAAGKELKAALVSVGYNDSAAVAFDTRLAFEWSLDKDGTLKELEQKIKVEAPRGRDDDEVSAKFEATKNTTTIDTGERGRERKVTRTGLALLELATESGQLRIEY